MSIANSNSRRQSLLVVISSPSGGGKTTLISRLLKKDKNLRRSVSVTTRPKRKGEISGRDYHFVTVRQFRNLIRQRGLAEYEQVHGYHYGTPKNVIDRAEKNGWTVLFTIDVNGALALKKKYPQSVLVFLLPPSWEILKQRLVGRKSESKASLLKRLKNARRELKFRRKYDYIIVNKEIEKCVSQIECIIQAEKSKTSRTQ